MSQDHGKSLTLFKNLHLNGTRFNHFWFRKYDSHFSILRKLFAFLHLLPLK